MPRVQKGGRTRKVRNYKKDEGAFNSFVAAPMLLPFTKGKEYIGKGFGKGASKTGEGIKLIYNKGKEIRASEIGKYDALKQRINKQTT